MEKVGKASKNSYEEMSKERFDADVGEDFSVCKK